MTIDIGTTTTSITTAAAANLTNQLLNDNELVHRKKKVYISNCPDAYKQANQNETPDKAKSKKAKLRINLNFFYKLLLKLVIFTILIHQRLQILFMQTLYSLLIVYDQIKSNLFKKSTAQQLEYKQIPKHVLVILNENITSESSITKVFSKIVDFFFKLGVETITFYDFDDINANVKEHLIKKYRDMNNVQSRANLNFYSYAQTGRCLFTRTCKTIALDVINNQIDIADVNKELVDDYILDSSKINEPQLVVSIGASDSLAGFSPWHLRLSEIIKIASFRLVNSYTLNNVMLKYNKIEKRFGK